MGPRQPDLPRRCRLLFSRSTTTGRWPRLSRGTECRGSRRPSSRAGRGCGRNPCITLFSVSRSPTKSPAHPAGLSSKTWREVSPSGFGVRQLRPCDNQSARPSCHAKKSPRLVAGASSFLPPVASALRALTALFLLRAAICQPTRGISWKGLADHGWFRWSFRPGVIRHDRRDL